MTNEPVKAKSQRRRMGRPVQPDENARRTRVVTLVTNAELTVLKSIAKTGNKSLSAVVHQILKDHLSQRNG